MARSNHSETTAPTTEEAASTPAPVVTTAAKLYDRLKDMAVSYHFRPGERINEVELAAQLKVSRTPLREALNRLATEGFLTITANKGFFARVLEANALFDLYELRAFLEQAAVRLACRRASDEEIATLRTFLLEQKESGESSAWAMLKLDEEFHLRLVSLSQNEELLKTVRSISERIRFARWIDFRSRRLSHRQHLHLTTLLAQRKEDECAAYVLGNIQRHFDQIREIIRGAVTEIYTRDSESQRKAR